MSDEGNAVELELHLPLAQDPDQRANLRVTFADGDPLDTATFRRGVEELTGLPVAALDDLAENLAELLALARHHGLLPPRT